MGETSNDSKNTWKNNSQTKCRECRGEAHKNETIHAIKLLKVHKKNEGPYGETRYS